MNQSHDLCKTVQKNRGFLWTSTPLFSRLPPFGLDPQVAYHVYLASDAAGTGRDRLTNETGRWVKGWGAEAGPIQG